MLRYVSSLLFSKPQDQKDEKKIEAKNETNLVVQFFDMVATTYAYVLEESEEKEEKTIPPISLSEPVSTPLYGACDIKILSNGNLVFLGNHNILIYDPNEKKTIAEAKTHKYSVYEEKSNLIIDDERFIVYNPYEAIIFDASLKILATSPHYSSGCQQLEILSPMRLIGYKHNYSNIEYHLLDALTLEKKNQFTLNIPGIHKNYKTLSAALGNSEYATICQEDERESFISIYVWNISDTEKPTIKKQLKFNFEFNKIESCRSLGNGHISILLDNNNAGCLVDVFDEKLHVLSQYLPYSSPKKDVTHVLAHFPHSNYKLFLLSGTKKNVSYMILRRRRLF